MEIHLQNKMYELVEHLVEMGYTDVQIAKIFNTNKMRIGRIKKRGNIKIK